jgi:hypothetical protein
MRMPHELDAFLTISEVDAGGFFVDELFQRKFGSAAPRDAHHVVAFHKRAPQQLRVLGYAHFLPFGDIMLVGGVCTDGAAFESMSAAEREAIRAAGGVYFNVLRYAFARFAGRCEAYFGYCGDARAETVNLAAGFVRTPHPHLLVNFHKPLHEVMQRALIAKAAAIGPF